MKKRLEVLAEHFHEWLRVQGYTESSRRSYRIYLNKFIRYLNKETQIQSISEITAEHIYSYQSDLYYAKTKQGKSLSVLTQHNALSVVRTFFRFLMKTNQLAFDPSCSITLPKKPQKLPEVISIKEVEHLLEQPDLSDRFGFRDRSMMEVFYVTGMRNSELCSLTLYDVDIENQKLRITHGKGQRTRIVPLGQIACNYLAEYLLSIRPRFLLDEKQQTLFLSKGGRSMSPVDVSMMIRKYAKAAGFKKRITAHTFRHCCATHMLRNGADIRYIQKLLGHTSTVSTQIYTHVEVKDLKDVHRKYHPREQWDGS